MKQATIARAGAINRSKRCLSLPASGGCNCSIGVNPPPNRPDPSIYSQAPLLADGTAATWDNPDIVLYQTPQYTDGQWQMPAGWFLNNVLVTVRNKSQRAAAINTVVAVSYGPCGIGMARTALATQLVSLAGGAAQQLSIPLPAAVLHPADGRPEAAIFVDLSHPYDLDQMNNHGESISAIELTQPDDDRVGGFNAVPIRLGNLTANPITYVLTVEPNNVGASLSATNVTVAPGAIGGVVANFGAPGLSPSQGAFTVVARDMLGKLAGGMTYRIYS